MLYWFWTQGEGLIVPNFPDRLITKASQLVRYTKELEEKIGVRNLREALSLALEDEIRSSFAIEGERLDSCRLRSSIARNMHLQSSEWSYPLQSRAMSEDRAVAAMLTFLEEKELLSHDILFKAHSLLGTGEAWGCYRTGAEYVRSDVKIVYEAPAAKYVRSMMDSLIQWWNGDRQKLPLPIGAALAHYYLVAIHPFADGNGRMARMMAEKALVASPHETFRPYSLSANIIDARGRYYAALDSAHSVEGIVGFVSFILNAQENAIQHAENRADRLHSLRAFLDEFGDEFNAAEQEILRIMHLSNRRQWTMFDATMDMQDGEAAMDAWDRLVADGIVDRGVLDLEAAGERLRNRIQPC